MKTTTVALSKTEFDKLEQMILDKIEKLEDGNEKNEYKHILEKITKAKLKILFK